MSKRKARNTGRPIASTRPGPLRTSKSNAPFWRNRKVWLGGAAGTVIAGVVTGILVNISVNELAAHKIASSPAPMLTLSLPGLAKKSPISHRQAGENPSPISAGAPLRLVWCLKIPSTLTMPAFGPSLERLSYPLINSS